MLLPRRVRSLVSLLLDRLALFVPLILVGALPLGRQSEADCQREASQSRDAVFDAAGHDNLRHSLTTTHRPGPTELRSFLIRIDVRLYLKIVEQIKIRIQVLVLIKHLQISHGCARLNRGRRTILASCDG